MIVHPEVETLLESLEEAAVAEDVQARVVGGIIWRREAVLILTRTRDSQFLPGNGDIPGGYALRGEGILDALVRETKEETGLTITSVDRYLGSFDYQSARGLMARQFNFEISVQGRGVTLMPDEHSSYTWCDPRDDDALRAQHLSPQLRGVVRAAKDARWGTC